ncbi:VOC family protein [Angustibacter speluncae]
MLRGPATVNLYVDDVAAAARWYADLLGIEPYYRRDGDDGVPAYLEFRFGDRETELGLIDRRWSPFPADATPGGVVLHWAVDDLDAAIAALTAAGATPLLPRTEHGPGFVTASFVDPFGNVLGVMHNVHYLEHAVA